MGSLYMNLLVLVGTLAIIGVVQAQDQQGFISIDCGLPSNEPPYSEPTTGIIYSSDANAVTSGKSGRVQKDFEPRFQKPYLFLRYFPDGKRNCYNLNVTRGTNYLIKATFVYGNYDGLDNYPNFDLYIGPNKWSSINMTGRDSGIVYEMIHFTRSYSLQVCLVKTRTTTPIISGLELRPLENITYTTQTGSLKLLFRAYLSNSVRFIRYPEDVHDRQWVPFSAPTVWTYITTTLNIDNSNIFKPPQAALRTAATPTNASASWAASWILDPPDTEFYLFFHFVEIQDLQANDTREFNIVLNGNVTSGPHRPDKLLLTTVYDRAPERCGSGKCVLELVRTQRSTLPPLINALEAYTVIQLPQLETDQDDVIAIKYVQATYGLSRISWQGDPCAPQQFVWDGLVCNYMDMYTQPRIISLNLSSSGLTRIIAPGIQNLTKLQQLDLSNNKLIGGVPEFLANMKSLSFINLSGNDLNGSIPQVLLDRQKDGLKLNVEGNPKLCPRGTCEMPSKSDGSSRNKLIMPILALVAFIAIIIFILVLILVSKKKKQSPSLPVIDVTSSEPPEPSIQMKKRRFTYSEVLKMTKNFQRVLGKGGFGVVYHGCLNDTEQVAVKVISQSSAQGYKQFKAEVELLLRVHHVNLVSLVGYCDEQDHLILIYEFMANGDLKEHLAGERGGSTLNWASRLRIAVEAALGLEYLHTRCKPQIIHRDIKSTNILLDENLEAKLGDFGLSRSFPIGGETHVSTVVAGTPGYLDPEYFRTNRLTEKSDVYSFGILLLEIITNQYVIDQAREKPNIAEWVGLMLDKGDIENIVDKDVYGDYDPSSVRKAVKLAMSCVNHSSDRRPNMSWIVHELNECLRIESSRIQWNRDMDSKSSLDLSMSFVAEVAPKAR